MNKLMSHIVFFIIGFFLIDLRGVKAQAKVQQKDVFQIGIFFGPPEIITNDEQYRKMKAAHIDYIQYIEDAYRPVGTTSEKRNLQILNFAHKYGLKYYPADQRVHGSDKDIEEMVKTYKNHPATGGYYVKDEPGKDALEKDAKVYNKLLALDPSKTPYVNLLPNWAVNEYEKDYVGTWISKVGAGKLKYLSFDNYPFMEDGSFRDTYFSNLDVIRRTGLKNGIKTSSYLQSVGIIGAYRRPNANELRYSAYTNIAYGIKNIVWFTYNTPGNVTKIKDSFTNAIITGKGEETDLYGPFKKINGEIKQLGKTLIQLDAVEVYHSGKISDQGVKKPPANFFWQPRENQDMIITYFLNRKTAKRYIMVVNKSLKEAREFSFMISGNVKNILQISKISDDKIKTNYAIQKKILSESLLPGDGKLYEIQ